MGVSDFTVCETRHQYSIYSKEVETQKIFWWSKKSSTSPVCDLLVLPVPAEENLRNKFEKQILNPETHSQSEELRFQCLN